MEKPKIIRGDKGRFEKGTVANPNGRPKKGETFTDILRSKADPEDIADRLIALAKKGDLAALKYIYDRMDGTPRQTIDQHVKGDIVPATFTVVDKDGNEIS
jgi:hypothetical protein